MIRRLFDLFRGGHYEYRIVRSKTHSCSRPRDGLFSASDLGDIWKCKCGKRYECTGYMSFGNFKRWTEIKAKDEIDEQEPMYKLGF